jgi:hypothetical protein
VCPNKKAAELPTRTALNKIAVCMTKVQNAFGTWLQSHSWTHWATFTTPYTLTLPSARRLMNRFGDMRVSTDINARKVVKGLFWAAEPFDCKEGYHTHALVDIDDSMPFKAVINAYQVATGNRKMGKEKWARVQMSAYDPQQAAAFYVSKYISKKLADYDLIRN